MVSTSSIQFSAFSATAGKSYHRCFPLWVFSFQNKCMINTKVSATSLEKQPMIYAHITNIKCLVITCFKLTNFIFHWGPQDTRENLNWLLWFIIEKLIKNFLPRLLVNLLNFYFGRRIHVWTIHQFGFAVNFYFFDPWWFLLFYINITCFISFMGDFSFILFFWTSFLHFFFYFWKKN